MIEFDNSSDFLMFGINLQADKPTVRGPLVPKEPKGGSKPPVPDSGRPPKTMPDNGKR